MDDLISRQAAINTVLNIRQKCDTNDIDEYRDILVECFEELPTAEPSATLMKVEVGVDKESLRKAMEEAELTLFAEPKKGEWVAFANEGGELDLRCSVCGEEQGFFFCYFNYCPNCGARMGE